MADIIWETIHFLLYTAQKLTNNVFVLYDSLEGRLYDRFMCFAQFSVAMNAEMTLYIDIFMVKLFTTNISVENIVICRFEVILYDPTAI